MGVRREPSAHTRGRRKSLGLCVGRAGNNTRADAGLVYASANNASSNSWRDYGVRLAINLKDLGLHYVAEDGKKRFGGKQVTLRSLQNVHIKIVDFETDVHTENGPRTVVSFEYDNGEAGKYFTADKQQLWYLEKIRAIKELPFDTTIGSEVFGNGKVRYMFT